MANFEWFCPGCETALAKWDYQAPIDHYRCYVCGLATPFIHLPRRDLLRTWSKRPGSVRIPRGIGGTTLEFDQTSTTIEGVACGSGSTLIVGATFNVVGFGPSPTSFSFTWNGQTGIQAVYSPDGDGRQACAIGYLMADSGSVSDLVVTPDQACEIAAFATELTLSSAPVLDASGFATTAVGLVTASCSSPNPHSPDLAIATCFPRGTPIPPFQLGQTAILGIDCFEMWAMTSGDASVVIDTGGAFSPVAAIATFGATQ